MITVDAVGCFESEEKINTRDGGEDRGEGGDKDRGDLGDTEEVDEGGGDIEGRGCQEKLDKEEGVKHLRAIEDIGHIVGEHKDIGRESDHGNEDIEEDGGNDDIGVEDRGKYTQKRDEENEGREYKRQELELEQGGEDIGNEEESREEESEEIGTDTLLIDKDRDEEEEQVKDAQQGGKERTRGDVMRRELDVEERGDMEGGGYKVEGDKDEGERGRWKEQENIIGEEVGDIGIVKGVEVGDIEDGVESEQEQTEVRCETEMSLS